MSYQNTLLKPKNSTQCHMTSCHKDVRYAIKTLGVPRRCQIMSRKHKLCDEDISYATKTSIRHKDGVPRYQYPKD